MFWLDTVKALDKKNYTQIFNSGKFVYHRVCVINFETTSIWHWANK